MNLNRPAREDGMRVRESEPGREAVDEENLARKRLRRRRERRSPPRREYLQLERSLGRFYQMKRRDGSLADRQTDGLLC